VFWNQNLSVTQRDAVASKASVALHRWTSNREDTVGDPVGQAIDLFVMGGGIRSLPAVVIAKDGDLLKLGVQGLTAGTAVFFQGQDPEPWVYGRVTETESDGVIIQIQGRHRPDRREFARAWGPVHVRYQAVEAEAYELAARRWLTKGEGIERRWIQPELFMNFSGSGLRFDGGREVGTGDRVLVGVRVPNDDREHRLTAEVVQSSENSGRSETSETALHFLQASEGAIMALVHFAERIQEQSLEDLETLD
jgi:hypothetical protein